MSKPETIIRALLELAEIQLNGSQHWEPQVQDERMFTSVLGVMVSKE